MEADAAARVASGLENQVQAGRLAARSRRAARAGMEDLNQGAALAGISDAIGTLSGAARTLSLEEVERGLELAAMAGQIGTVGDAVRSLGMESLGGFLDEMSLRMRHLAMHDILDSQDEHGLARAIGEAGADLALLGESEMAAGLAALESAQAAADAGDLAAAVGTAQVAEGMAEAASTEVPAGTAG